MQRSLESLGNFVLKSALFNIAIQADVFFIFLLLLYIEIFGRLLLFFNWQSIQRYSQFIRLQRRDHFEIVQVILIVINTLMIFKINVSTGTHHLIQINFFLDNINQWFLSSLRSSFLCNGLLTLRVLGIVLVHVVLNANLHKRLIFLFLDPR